jgi:hypothetical protein
MEGGGLEEDLQQLKLQPRSIRGDDSMVFVATHPLNYKPAIDQLP